MSLTAKPIVRVKDLVVGVKNDENTRDSFRFKIDYGTFDINLGDFVLFKGRNGSGKSTFLKLFRMQSVDYFKIVGGEIFFLDDKFPEKTLQNYSTDELTRLNCMVSYIGQEERFLTGDSAYSYIYSTCKIALSYDRGLSGDGRAAKLKEVDGIIADYYTRYLSQGFLCKNYETFRRKSVRSWSGGQQKMINALAGIIKAEVCGLKLLIMDEPLNNLDGANKFILNNLIGELRKREIAVVAVTHCQVFDGVNKVVNLLEGADGNRYAEVLAGDAPPHSDCLENYR